MRFIDELSRSLDTLHERPVEVIKKAERLINIGIIAMALLIFILGGELIISLVILISLNRTLKDLFRGNLPFVRRWTRMSVKMITYVFIMGIIIYILEFTVPSIKTILYFTL